MDQQYYIGIDFGIHNEDRECFTVMSKDKDGIYTVLECDYDLNNLDLSKYANATIIGSPSNIEKLKERFKI